ncbi:MAG TPA: hydroxymethylbilane synthase [Solirubrobacteraceae bacterium]|nr:hydroxymethylbilane synthase [Solirubrobacteraceae bacterium]
MIRLGTRGSALALAQANWVASQIEGAELVTITTAGDRGARVADKSRWTSELERALLAGGIDLAVHSAKDVPGELAPGTEIVAVPRREDPRDVICGAVSLAALPQGARVGTSSLRRASQLRALRADLAIVELRGNVDTRLRKLDDGDADAIVLAAAGLRRLGRESELGGVLAELVPAPGQGALIVQGRTGDPVSARVAEGALDDTSARLEVTAERAFAHALGASCLTPLGASATASFGSVSLAGWIGLPDGSHWIADSLTGPFDEVGRRMAERMLAAGAGELLGTGEPE